MSGAARAPGGMPPPSSGQTPAPGWRQRVGIPLNVVLFLFLMVLGWGDLRGFFAHPVRVGVVVVHLAMLPVMTLCTSGRSRGVRHLPDAPEFFPLLVAHSLFTAWLLPWMDARDLWTLPGGDAVRWAGFFVLVAGAALRIAAMLSLGRRFTAVVGLQPGHRLHTSGLYAVVRHPSYLGILLVDLGFAGVFRSAVALALIPAVFMMFKRRIDVEERLLEDAFGPEYRDYRARTRRLLPRVY